MWRYKVVAIAVPTRHGASLEACEAKLNELGGEGWEAVAVIQQGDGWWVLLKMPHEVGTY